MRRSVLLLAIGLLAALAAPARAAEWLSQQLPGPGPGATPLLLGEVGDLECWSADRCALITPGVGSVEAGIFAYDGASWYRYSTVCGGRNGRIAWVGPDEFWTVSDQQPGQETTEKPDPAISLCHFKGGEVIASYGEPIGLAGSYQQMSAAACAPSGECWFAGERLPGTENVGSFHLRWDGATLAPVPALTAAQPGILDPSRQVTALAGYGGRFYEGVDVASGDVAVPAEEEAGEPSWLHRIDPGAATPFQPLFPFEPLEYGPANPVLLGGFRLAADSERLWAFAGADGATNRVTAMLLDAGGLAQLPLADSEGVFELGDRVADLDAEAGADSAWVAFSHSTDSFLPPARLAQVAADGTVGPEVTLPAAGEEVAGEGIGSKGRAAAVSCSGPAQCWMVTEKGWLFHLGADPGANGDPALHALITYRPPDNSLPVVVPTDPPEDTSGSELEEAPELEIGEIEPQVIRRRALVAKIRQKVVRGTILEVSFTLRAGARVQLVAKHKRRTVAKTRQRRMGRGRRHLRVRLDPKRWPTKVDLRAKRIKRGKR